MEQQSAGTEEDEAGTTWAMGVAKEWSAELSDTREDIYTLNDGDHFANAPVFQKVWRSGPISGISPMQPHYLQYVATRGPLRQPKIEFGEVVMVGEVVGGPNSLVGEGEMTVMKKLQPPMEQSRTT